MRCLILLAFLCLCLPEQAVACCVEPPMAEFESPDLHRSLNVPPRRLSPAAVAVPPGSVRPADAWPPIVLIATLTMLTLGIIALRALSTPAMRPLGGLRMLRDDGAETSHQGDQERKPPNDVLDYREAA